MIVPVMCCALRVRTFKATLMYGFTNVLTERTSQHVPIALFIVTSRLEELRPRKLCDMLAHGCYFATRSSLLPINWMVFEGPGIHVRLRASKDYSRERSETVHAYSFESSAS